VHRGALSTTYLQQHVLLLKLGNVLFQAGDLHLELEGGSFVERVAQREIIHLPNTPPQTPSCSRNGRDEPFGVRPGSHLTLK
jgi:hypothetical protein